MRIALIGCEALLTTTLAEFLSALGHEVLSFHSVGELLQAPSDGSPPPEIIISRSAFTGNRDFDALRALHHRYPDSALVLYMSALSHSLQVDKALECGLHAYLHEPLNLCELELVVTRLAESRGHRGPERGKCPESGCGCNSTDLAQKDGGARHAQNSGSRRTQGPP